jgi:hypothetical protein
MAKSIVFDPEHLQLCIQFVCLGARPGVVASILQGFRSTEVEKIARDYARQMGLSLPKGPMAADDARVTLATLTRRMHMAGAISAYLRALNNGVSEAKSLLVGYKTYQRTAFHLRRNPDQYVTFERFHAACRSFAELRLKMRACGQCDSDFIVSDNPQVPRDCPFCAARKKGLLNGHQGAGLFRDLIPEQRVAAAVAA